MFVPAAVVALAVAALFSATADAQQSSSGDPITGRWNGRVGPGANPKNALTLALRVTDTVVMGEVSGTDQPGEIRRGSYNPATGALYLELGIVGQPGGTQLTLLGTAVEGTAIGRATRGGGATGTFILRRADSASAPVDHGDPTSVSREQLKATFDEINTNIAKAAALVPENKYTFRPVSTVRTFGQLVGHVIDASEYYCGRAAGRAAVWSDSTALGHSSKARLIAHLDAATASCRAALATGGAPPVMVNVAHENLHYGNMVTYMRLLGIVPPSSR